MAAPPIRKSKLSQSQRDAVRKSHINSSHFDPAWMSEGGPIELYQHCGFVSNSYRKGYANINWKGKDHEQEVSEVR